MKLNVSSTPRMYPVVARQVSRAGVLRFRGIGSTKNHLRDRPGP